MDEQNEQLNNKSDKTILKNLWKEVVNLFAAAMFWYGYGLKVIPVLPGSKRPALRWDPWLSGLNNQKIQQHWEIYPDREVGFIVGDDLIVLDADTPESADALKEIEALHDLTPKMVVKTAKGEHHYYRRAPGTVAKSDSHDSEKYPERIDVKTGRALVILPISTGKSIHTLEADSKSDLSEATQEFIDAIYKHNGRAIASEKLALPLRKADESSLQKIESLLNSIDPDSGYDDWLRVGMAIFHETAGSEDGLALFDRWSSKGNKYMGFTEVEAKWSSFSLEEPKPVTIATLVMMARYVEDTETEDFKLAHARGAVNRLLEKSITDSAAPLEPEAIQALAIVKNANEAEFFRIRTELKRSNREISLTALDNAINAVYVEGEIEQTHHGYARDLIANTLTVENWAPVGHQGSLFVLDPESNIWVRESNEELIRLVAGNYDGRDNCKRITDYRGITELSIMLATDHEFFTDAPIGLATPGGFIQIINNEIITAPLSPSQRQRVKVDYTTKEQSTPMFSQFLSDTFYAQNPQEMQDQVNLLQEIMGAIMIGIMAIYHKAILFYDPFGRAGKGTLAQIIEALIPSSFVTAVSPFYWDREYYLATLIGSRLNIVGELEDSKSIPAAAFKTVTGRDPLTGRQPNQRTVTFKNEAAHLFMSNFLINTKGHTEAFFTRWLIVEFPNSRLRSGKPIDTGLAENIIKHELPGIAYWAFLGAKRLLVNGEFSQSIVHDRLMAKWRYSTNSLEEFIHECCDLDATEHVRRSVLYAKYKEWCDENGRRPFSKGKVKELLAANIKLGITHTVLKAIEVFRGIKMKGVSSERTKDKSFREFTEVPK